MLLQYAINPNKLLSLCVVCEKAYEFTFLQL